MKRAKDRSKGSAVIFIMNIYIILDGRAGIILSYLPLYFLHSYTTSRSVFQRDLLFHLLTLNTLLALTNQTLVLTPLHKVTDSLGTEQNRSLFRPHAYKVTKREYLTFKLILMKTFKHVF